MTQNEIEIVESWVISPNLALEISRWNIKYLTSNIVSWRSWNVWTTEKDIWEEFWNMSYLTSAEQLSLSSDNVWDAQNWTWAKTITIYWLDSNYNEISEVISTHATDGTIAVTTVKSYLRVNKMIVTTAWSSWKCLWILKLKDSSLNTQCIVNDWTNISLMSQYTVPAWKTCYLCYWDVSVWEWKSAVIKFYIRNFWGLFFAWQIIDIFETNYTRKFTTPLKITEKSDIVVKAVSSASWTKMSINYDMILIDNTIE